MESKFTLKTRDFALTYAKCTETPERLLDYFRCKFDDKQSYIAVVREFHKDGDPHLHAHVQFKNRFHATERTFDFSDFHPNVQGVKNSLHWKGYLEKAGTPLTSGEFQILTKKKEKLSNFDLLNGDLQGMIDNEELSIFSLSAVLNARKAYQEIRARQKPDLPLSFPANWEGLTLTVHPPSVKQRHYWLYSSVPNMGKSTFLQLLDNTYRASYYSCAEKFQSINADSQLLLFDEFGKGNSTTITVLNLICDGSYKFPCKSRPALTLNKPLAVVASNFPISDVYPNSNGRVEARFIEICLDNYLFINPA